MVVSHGKGKNPTSKKGGSNGYEKGDNPNNSQLQLKKKNAQSGRVRGGTIPGRRGRGRVHARGRKLSLKKGWNSKRLGKKETCTRAWGERQLSLGRRGGEKKEEKRGKEEKTREKEKQKEKTEKKGKERNQRSNQGERKKKRGKRVSKRRGEGKEEQGHSNTKSGGARRDGTGKAGGE